MTKRALYRPTVCGLAALAVALSAACTSIQWSNGSGFDNHVGLLTYELIRSARGEEVRVTSLGVDVRLSGDDCGVSAGLKSVSEIKPGVVEVSNPKDLAKQVGLAHSTSVKGARERGFFYLSEDITRGATIVDASVYGIDASAPAKRPSLTLGYDHSFNYVGDIVAQDASEVQVYRGGNEYSNLSVIRLRK